MLTSLQDDAITETINIAFSRSAASLSDLTGSRVDLEVPVVSVHPISDIAVALKRFVSGEVATVHQVFTGPVAGDAFLLMNFDGAVHLVELLTDGEVPAKGLGDSAREVVTEIGNIVMNACLGVFGNLLRVRFSFSVPRLSLDDLGAMSTRWSSTSVRCSMPWSSVPVFGFSKAKSPAASCSSSASRRSNCFYKKSKPGPSAR